jgi:hypothetical protein
VPTTRERLDELCRECQRAASACPVDVAGRDGAFKEARRLLQDKKARDLLWFEDALFDPQKRFFAAAVLHGVLPRRLLRPILRAATLGPDVSSNQVFVKAALASGYSVTEIVEVLQALVPDAPNRRLAESAFYWVDPQDFEDLQVRNRCLRMSAEERIRWFMSTDDPWLRRRIAAHLPFNDPGLSPELRALLEEATRGFQR